MWRSRRACQQSPRKTANIDREQGPRTRSDYAKARDSFRFPLRVSSQQPQPRVYDQAPNLSRVLRLWNRVQVFTRDDVHRAPTSRKFRVGSSAGRLKMWAALRFLPTFHSAHIQAPPAIGHDNYSNHRPDAGASNNLQPTSNGTRGALSWAVGLGRA